MHAIILGCVSRNGYLKIDGIARIAWVIGVIDGIVAMLAMIDKEAIGSWPERCLDGLTTEQIKAFFEKELNGKPESWHVPAALILTVRCKTSAKKGY